MKVTIHRFRDRNFPPGMTVWELRCSECELGPHRFYAYKELAKDTKKRHRAFHQRRRLDPFHGL